MQLLDEIKQAMESTNQDLNNEIEEIKKGYNPLEVLFVEYYIYGKKDVVDKRIVEVFPPHSAIQSYASAYRGYNDRIKPSDDDYVRCRTLGAVEARKPHIAALIDKFHTINFDIRTYIKSRTLELSQSKNGKTAMAALNLLEKMTQEGGGKDIVISFERRD